MDKYDIVTAIERFAPVETAELWDCSGWLIETTNKNINKVMLCLTPTLDIINQAVVQNCDMILSHHPMFYVPTTKPAIDIYCAHTNLDKANGGTTDTLIDTFLSLVNLDKETVNITKKGDYLRYITLSESVNLEFLVNILRKISPNLRYTNNRDIQNIKTIAFCCGSGSEFIPEVECDKIDCYVTGDIKFHTALDSNLVLFDIGHFESEILCLSVFENLLSQYDIEIVRAEEVCPFIY